MNVIRDSKNIANRLRNLFENDLRGKAVPGLDFGVDYFLCKRRGKTRRCFLPTYFRPNSRAVVVVPKTFADTFDLLKRQALDIGGTILKSKVEGTTVEKGVKKEKKKTRGKKRKAAEEEEEEDEQHDSTLMEDQYGGRRRRRKPGIKRRRKTATTSIRRRRKVSPVKRRRRAHHRGEFLKCFKLRGHKRGW